MAKPWDVWRIIKEVDLEAVRAEAERSFRVLVLGEVAGDAQAMTGLLSSGRRGEVHPWVVAAEAGLHPPLTPLPDVAVLVTRETELPPRLAIAAQELAVQKVPAVTVVVGSKDSRDGVIRPGEASRAAVGRPAADHLDAIAQALLSGTPAGLRLALGRQLPPVRDPLFAALIEETARANAVYALGTGVAEIVPLLNIPLNLADMVVLTKNQVVMAYRIALGAGKRGTVKALLGQTLSVIGSGFMLRQVARQLVGLVPVIGLAPKVAVAYAGTWAVGKAVAVWAGGGAEVTKASVARYYAEALERGRSVAEAAGAAARVGARTTRATTSGVGRLAGGALAGGRRVADAIWFAGRARRSAGRRRG
jgi:uncharacterized protein (DUF697 family)